MRKTTILEIGSKYGRLTVIEKSDIKGKGSTYKTLCDCGKFTLSEARCLKSGKVTTCGCKIGSISHQDYSGKTIGSLQIIRILTDESYIKRRYECLCTKCNRVRSIRNNNVCDIVRRGISTCVCTNKVPDWRTPITQHELIGTTIGNLKVVKFVGHKKYTPYYRCECECGKVVDRSATSLNKCVKKNQIARCCNFCGLSAPAELSGNIPMWYIKSIKQGAEVRKFEHSISDEYLNELLIKQNHKCKLSGMDISFGDIPMLKNKYELSTASLDRIDSNMGI